MLPNDLRMGKGLLKRTVKIVGVLVVSVLGYQHIRVSSLGLAGRYIPLFLSANGGFWGQGLGLVSGGDHCPGGVVKFDLGLPV